MVIWLCKDLIKLASECGCDAVKLQKRTITEVYSKELLDSPRESPWGTTQRQQKEGLEFNHDQYREIDLYCNSLGIEWFASAWDINSQNFLRNFNCKFNKIASAMLTHLSFLRHVAEEKNIHLYQLV